METQQIAILEKKLHKLQITVLGLIGLVVIVGVLATIGPANALLQVSDVLQTKKLEILDDDGNLVAQLLSDADGGTLELYDKSNVATLRAYIDQDGVAKVDLGATGHRGQLIIASAAAGGPAVDIGARDNERGFINIKDANGLSAA